LLPPEIMGSLHSHIQPFFRALGSVVRCTADLRLWIPFAALGFLKLLGIVLLARIDLVPSLWLSALLHVIPQLEESVRYPELILQLPRLARLGDLGLFLTLAALVEGWAIVRFVESWTGQEILLWPDSRRGIRRIASLMGFAAIIALIPWAVRLLGQTLASRQIAVGCALAAGLVAQALLFCAPVFRIVDDLSLWQSIRRSISVFLLLPLALPLCVLFLIALHIPTLLLRSPVFSPAIQRDPEWIWIMLAAQVPFDVVGAFLSVALATRLRLSNVVHQNLSLGG